MPKEQTDQASRSKMKVHITAICVGVISAVIAAILLAQIQNDPPNAKIEASNQIGTPPLEVIFEGSSSIDSDGRISKYEWFIQNTPVSQENYYKHTFNEYGTYCVKLTVTDDDGSESNAVLFINVIEPDKLPFVTLYSETDFTGESIIINQEGSKHLQEWGDRAKSMVINNGTWVFYDVAGWNEDPIHKRGRYWTFKAGEYPNLSDYDCASCISSIKFLGVNQEQQ